MAKIAIVGVGAIGSAVAALLEKTGQHEVLLCVRRPLPELIVEYGADRRAVHGRRVLNPAEAPPVVWVLVVTKTYDVAGAADMIIADAKHGDAGVKSLALQPVAVRVFRQTDSMEIFNEQMATNEHKDFPNEGLIVTASALESVQFEFKGSRFRFAAKGRTRGEIPVQK